MPCKSTLPIPPEHEEGELPPFAPRQTPAHRAPIYIERIDVTPHDLAPMFRLMQAQWSKTTL